MTSEAVAFVLLVGPQASGKSTIGRALSEELRREGERVALVELDQIAEMALPTLPSWDTASRIFAMVAGAWARADLTCVIAEGISSQDEVSILREQVPVAARMITVAMTTPFEAALPRARADQTRRAPRDRDWLAERYQEWSQEMDRIAADVLSRCEWDVAGSVCAETERGHPICSLILGVIAKRSAYGAVLSRVGACR